MPHKPETPSASPAVRKFLAAVGRKGGQATTTRKARSSAANGKLGGRPKTKKAER